MLRVEPALIIDEYDILLREPLSYHVFTFATSSYATLTHRKAYGELLGLLGVVIAPDLILLWIDTFKLFLPSCHL